MVIFFPQNEVLEQWQLSIKRWNYGEPKLVCGSRKEQTKMPTYTFTLAVGRLYSTLTLLSTFLSDLAALM